MKSNILILIVFVRFTINAQVEFQKYFNPAQYVVLKSYALSHGLLFNLVDSSGTNPGFCKVLANGEIDSYRFFTQNSLTPNASFTSPLNDSDYCHVLSTPTGFGICKTRNYNMLWQHYYAVSSEVKQDDITFGNSALKIFRNGKLCLQSSATILLGDTLSINCPIITMFSAEGLLIWSKLFRVGFNNFNPIDIVENSKGNILLVGDYVNDASGSNRSITTMEINVNDGTIVGSGDANSYTNKNGDIILGKLDNVSKAIVFSGNNLNSQNNMSAFVGKINDNGMLDRISKVTAIDTNGSIRINAIKSWGNANYLIGTYSTKFPVTGNLYDNPICVKMDTANASVIWAKSYGEVPVDVVGQFARVFYDFIINPQDSTLLFSGTTDKSSGYLWKASQKTGNTFCKSMNVNLNVEQFALSSSSISTAVIYANYFINDTITSISGDTLLNLSKPTFKDACAEVGIDDEKSVKEPAFLIYPNPANQFLMVSNKDIAINRIVISDIFGRKLREYSAENHIDISHLKPGIYFITILNDKHVVVGLEKLVVDR